MQVKEFVCHRSIASEFRIMFLSKWSFCHHLVALKSELLHCLNSKNLFLSTAHMLWAYLWRKPVTKTLKITSSRHPNEYIPREEHGWGIKGRNWSSSIMSQRRQCYLPSRHTYTYSHHFAGAKFVAGLFCLHICTYAIIWSAAACISLLCSTPLGCSTHSTETACLT